MNNSARRPFCGATIKRRPEKRRPRKSCSEIRRSEKKKFQDKSVCYKKGAYIENKLYALPGATTKKNLSV